VKKPLISVIVPVYNVEDYIEECIDSIIAQTFKNFELIVIDDASQDCSFEKAVKRLQNTEINFKTIVLKKNQGLSNARNEGMKIAAGKYLNFMDSDDWIPPHALETLYNAAILHNASIVAANKLIVRDQKTEKLTQHITETKTLSPIDALNGMLFNYQPTDNACVKLYRKELFDTHKIRFEKGRYHEDFLANIHLLYHAEKVVVIPDIVYYHRKREGSIINSFSIKHIEDSIFMTTYYIDFIRQKKLTDDAYGHKAHYLIGENFSKLYGMENISNRIAYTLHKNIFYNFREARRLFPFIKPKGREDRILLSKYYIASFWGYALLNNRFFSFSKKLLSSK
jgi:glycosyltransferase involved in cell wall biosynthesis